MAPTFGTVSAGGQRLPQQDSHWIQQVMQRHEKALVRYAYHITGNADTARDVVQDTFFRLCKADREAVEARVTAWLYRVCRNRALDLKRKGKPMQHASDARLSSCHSDEPSPAAVAQQRQAVGQAVQLLADLPHKQQEVVRLKFQQGLSYREIARVTGQSVTNVGYLIHTAMRTLRQQMIDHAQPAGARRIR